MERETLETPQLSSITGFWQTTAGRITGRVAAVATGCGLLAASLGFGSTDVDIAVPTPCEYQQKTSYILVALDGVRWQEIFQGTDPTRSDEVVSARALTPHIHALADKGVAIGAPDHTEFSASGPNFVSLPGYSEMLVGRPPACTDNDCSQTASFTLIDGFAERYGAESVAAFTSWRNIERVAASSNSEAGVSAGRTGGRTRSILMEDPAMRELLEHGEEDFDKDDYRPDALTIPLALEFMRKAPPSFMFVSLGDTDEHAHHDEYNEYLEALRNADNFIGQLSAMADARRAAGIETVIIVTTDHGRAANFKDHGGPFPESSRTWLVASGGPVPIKGEVATSTARTLSDIAPTIASWAGVRMEIAETTGTLIPELSGVCGPVRREAPAANAARKDVLDVPAPDAEPRVWTGST